MKEKLTSNIGLKVLSLLLATLLWLGVINSQDPLETVTFTDIPVTIINEDALTAKDKIPEVVEGDKISVVVEIPSGDFKYLSKHSSCKFIKLVQILYTMIITNSF